MPVSLNFFCHPTGNRGKFMRPRPEFRILATCEMQSLEPVYGPIQHVNIISSVIESIKILTPQIIARCICRSA